MKLRFADYTYMVVGLSALWGMVALWLNAAPFIENAPTRNILFGTIILLGSIFAIGVVIDAVKGVYGRCLGKPSPRSIRIISTPSGDAPLWVRERWVGLKLPIVGSNRRRSLGVSVNVKPTVLHHLWAVLHQRTQTITGYQVEVQRAVDILGTASPEAAEWWRQNCPDLLRTYHLFVFHTEVCQINEA
jgi:hypothetical protein